MKNLYIGTEDGAHYNAGILAGRILRKDPGIRESAEYRAMEDRLFDYTNACDNKEQFRWMCYYMGQAIKLDNEACNLMSRGKAHWNTAAGMKHEAALLFIVAYDMIGM